MRKKCRYIKIFLNFSRGSHKPFGDCKNKGVMKTGFYVNILEHKRQSWETE